MYTLYVTDENNEPQINETRDWLKSLAKNVSRMGEIRSLPDDMPHGELQAKINAMDDDADFHKVFESHEVARGWHNVVLDTAGFEAVLRKKEWISDIDRTSIYKSVACDNRAVRRN